MLDFKVRLGADGDQVELDQPYLSEDIAWIWRAWLRLNDGRSWMGGGMGPAIPTPISFSAVLEWSRFHEYDEDMVRMLDHCVREMDRVYIARMIEKAKASVKVKK